MFDLFRYGPIKLVGWFFDKDDTPGAGGDPDDSAEDKSKEEDKSKAGDPPDPTAEKKFSQAELEEKIKERLERERAKAKKESETAKKQAEQDALAKNQEWQALAETRAKEIADLTQERDGLTPYKDQAEKYKKALETQLATVKESLPKHITELIEKLDPVDQLTYISTHAKDLAIKPNAYGETPDPKERKLSADEESIAQRASRSVVTNNF